MDYTQLNRIHVHSIDEVFSKTDVELVKKQLLNKIEPHGCHKNTALACLVNVKGYKIDFCEGGMMPCGVAYIPHCWNRVTRLSDNKVFYIDLTKEFCSENPFGPEYMDYRLFKVWTGKAIVDLFNKYQFSFTPHEGLATEGGYISAHEIYRKHKRA